MIGRITSLDYIQDDDLGVLIRLSARMKDGSKFNGYVKETEPYIYAPEDEQAPDENFIKRTETGYKSIFNHRLQKIVTKTPKQASDLTKNFSWTGEADVPYYRRVSIHDGLSGYVDIPKTDETYDGYPLIDIDDVDVDPDFTEVIHPRISIEDIEVEVPEDQSFDDMVESASQPINVICSYDTYEEKYTVFYYDRYDNLDTSAIRPKMQEQLSETDIESYTDAPIEILSSDSESDMLNSYIDYVNDSEFDLISGWNYVDFDRKYIRRRMKELDKSGEDIHPSWLSPFNETSFTRDEHRKIVGRPPFDMMKAFCFSGDTDVLTPSGIENIKDIEVGDDVYTLNEDTHRVEVKPVTDTHITENKWGKLEYHTGRSHDFKVTPNHRFYLPDDPEKPRSELSPEDYSYKEYRDISQNEKRYKFPQHKPKSGLEKEKFNLGKERDVTIGVISDKNGMWLRNKLNNDENSEVTLTHGTSERFGFENRVGKYRIPSRIYRKNTDIIEEYADYLFIKSDTRTTEIPVEYDMEDWLELMGWYISEGYVEKKSKSLHICQQKEVGREAISLLLERMNIPYTSNQEEYRISSQAIGNWFMENCGSSSYRKKIPEFVFDLDSHYLQYLLWSLIEGDGSGSLSSDSSVCYTTASENLKEDVMKLALVCGYKASHREHSEYNYIHQIDISKQGGSFKKSNGKTINHEGEVYCITAKDNHTIMAGRNGKFSWIGQCDKLTFSNWRSKSLEYVSNEELGIGKIDDVDINYDWKNQPSRLIAYNIVDVLLTVALDDKNDIHGFFYEMADVCSIPITDVFYEKRQVDGDLMSKRSDKEILPTTEETEDINNAGGYVADPANGRIENVGVSDLKSLYPSAMITWNLSTETLSNSPDGFDEYIKVPKVPEPKDVKGEIEEAKIDFDWMYTSFDQEGILPRSIKHLFKKRNQEKEKMYAAADDSAEKSKWNRKQGATKVLMNSYYGVASSKYWRLSNQFLGDAVTSTARYTLWKGKQTLDRLEYEHVYSDTDSHMFKVSDGPVEKQVEELKQVSTQMDKDASEILADCGYNNIHPFLKDSDLHGDEYTCMKWEAEKLGIHLQLGRKKRYAQAIDWKEGTYYDEPKISISGFENARSDSMPITAELQEEVIRKVLFGAGFDEVSEYLRSIIEQIDADSPDVERFALPGSINKALENYPNRQIPRASMWSNQHLNRDFGEGDDPFVYLVKETPSELPNTDVLALEWNEEIPDGFKLDKEAIVERGVKKPIESIVNEMNWKFEELRAGQKQQQMDFGGGNPFE